MQNNVFKRTGDKWSDPKNIEILPDSLVAAHPAISPDGLHFILFLILQGALVKRISGK